MKNIRTKRTPKIHVESFKFNKQPFNKRTTQQLLSIII